jgi:glyoxylase-like metal-dependent hydrolase (beta-lactamase superfamily II)
VKHLTYVRGPFVNNVYVLVAGDGRTAAVIDPGLECDDVMEDIERRGLSIAMLLNTHGHPDHAGGNASFRARFGAPLIAHPADRPLRATVAQLAAMFGVRAEASPEPDRLIHGGETLELGGEQIRVLHTPGHTPGGCCFLVADALYSGDTLFFESIGRSDLPGGDGEQLVNAIREKLYVLPDETRVYPGHGEATTIGHEKLANPFT